MTTQPLPTDFPPPRRKGVIVHVFAILLLAGVIALALWFAVREQAGLNFVLALLLSLVLIFPLGLSLYRTYALLQASYTLERDGLRLRWGLRAEDIPLPQIEWVRPASDMGFHMPLPLAPLPGGILGTRTVEGLGPVEYLASERGKMLLIATPERIFVISPANPNAFIRTFQRSIELGSLSPIPSRTALPVAFFRRVWSDGAARPMMLAGLVLTAALFILVSLLIPTLGQVALGFDSDGQPLGTTAAEWLLLLPVLGTFAFVADLIGGLFFFRNPDGRPIAYLLWAGGIVTPVLLIVAVLFLIRV